MKNASNIKTSIRSFRGRRMACRTYQTEDQVIRDIENSFGEILIPQREIDQILLREKKQALRANASKKSLLKTFQQRKKALLIQNLVENRDNNMGKSRKQIRSSISEKKQACSQKSQKEVIVNEIELEY